MDLLFLNVKLLSYQSSTVPEIYFNMFFYLYVQVEGSARADNRHEALGVARVRHLHYTGVPLCAGCTGDLGRGGKVPGTSKVPPVHSFTEC